MVKNKVIIYNLILLLVIFAMLITSTFAWLVVSNEIDINKVGGSVITQYFHCGTGSEDDPFVITRPIHYYNLVMLYQLLEGYADENFCFKIGCDANKLTNPSATAVDGDQYVFNYADDGTTDGTASSVLNMAYYSDGLLPIGSSAIPFGGTLNGGNIVVKNLKVIAQLDEKGTADLGIFGYITEGAVISDIYFDNITLSLENINSADALQESTSSATHTAHSAQAYVGYLAGHIAALDTITLSKVYFNNVSVTGGAAQNSDAISSLYGYFGYVDGDIETISSIVQDLTENDNAAGNDYSFHFYAPDMYSFLSELDMSLPLVTRNWYADDQGDTLEDALSADGNAYFLNGLGPDSTSAEYNYSLNTIGYTGTFNNYTSYEAFYLNGSAYTPLPDTVTTTTLSPDGQLAIGDYCYYDASSGKWVYYECTTAPSVNYYTYNFSIATNYTFTISNARNATVQTSATATLYIDGQQRATANVTVSSSGNNTKTVTVSTAGLDFGDIQLAEGTHYYAILIPVSYTNRGQTTYRYYYYGSYSNNTLAGNELEVSADGEQSVSLSYTTNTVSYSDDREPAIVISGSALYDGPYDIYYSDNSSYVQSDHSSSTFTVENNSVYYNIYSDETTTKDVFISDLFAEYPSSLNADETSGYNSKNLDIIGGLHFYNNYLYMSGYGQDATTLESTDLGQQFYANAYFQDGFAIRVKNVNDATDDTVMGNLTVYFEKYDGSEDWEDMLSLVRGQSMRKAFTTDLGATTVDDNTDGYAGLSASILKSNLENCAYCAIDADGNIVAISNGSDDGLTYADGKTSADVAYYILLFCIYSGHVQVNEIVFDFKGEEGKNPNGDPLPLVIDAPLFTDIDYRSSNQTHVDPFHALMVLEYEAPISSASDTFSIEVVYEEGVATDNMTFTGVYNIYITNTVTDTFTLSVLLCDDNLVDTDSYLYAYQIFYNGTAISNVSTTYFQNSKTHTLPSSGG